MSTLANTNDWDRTLGVLGEAFDAQFNITVLSDTSLGTLKPVIQNVAVGKYRLVILLL